MIVYGFGDYFTDCQNTLTGDNYRAFNQVDSIKSARRSLTAPVAGASGAFDFYGSGYWPAEPLSITTEADIMYSSWATSGDTAEILINNLWKKSRSKLWLVRASDSTSSPYRYRRPRPPDGAFPGTYTLSGEILVGAVQVAGSVWLYDTDYQILATTTASSSSSPGYSFSVPTGTYRVHARHYDGTVAVGAGSVYYYGTSNATSVTGNTDLDVTVTNPIESPSSTARPEVAWAWAKLVNASVVSSVKARNPRSVKIQAEFEIPEGVFYDIDIKGTTITESSSKSITLINGGNVPTHVKWSLTALTHTITDFRVQNGTSGSDITWSGTLLADDVLVLDSSIYTATNDGAAVFTGIVYNPPVTQLGWCVLYPGSNSLTISLTQDTTEDYSITYEFYDAMQP